MKYYTYILSSKKLNKYYVGSTNGIDDRLERHLSSKKGFTSRAKDWSLEYSEVYDSRSEAVKR